MKLRNETCFDTNMILTNLTLLRRYILKHFMKNEKICDRIYGFEYDVQKYDVSHRLRMRHIKTYIII